MTEIEMKANCKNLRARLKQIERLKRLRKSNARLEEAKEIIESLYYMIPASIAEQSKETIARARNFMKEQACVSES